MTSQIQSVLDCRNWDDECPVCIDATLGTAGHTLDLLSANPRLQIVAFDRDLASSGTARKRLAEAQLIDRVTTVHCDYRYADLVIEAMSALSPNELTNLDNKVLELPIDSVGIVAIRLGKQLKETMAAAKPWPIRGALIDAGMSLHQISQAQRGLSFRDDGPLDMRYDTTQNISAYDLVNELAEDELSTLLFRYTDERWARRIAAAIARTRQSNPIHTTAELAGIITAAIPAGVRRKSRVHPATKSFAALRMAVNDEYWALEEGAWALSRSLAINARLAILTYSSTEDRTVKRTFRRLAGVLPEVLPPSKTSRKRGRLRQNSLLFAITAARSSLSISGNLDILPTDHSTLLTPQVLQQGQWGENWEMKIITRKPQVPTDDQIAANPLERSAKLRVVEKVAVNSPL